MIYASTIGYATAPRNRDKRQVCEGSSRGARLFWRGHTTKKSIKSGEKEGELEIIAFAVGGGGVI